MQVNHDKTGHGQQLIAECLAIGERTDTVAEAMQQIGDQIPNLLIMVDDQNLQCGRTVHVLDNNGSGGNRRVWAA